MSQKVDQFYFYDNRRKCGQIFLIFRCYTHKGIAEKAASTLPHPSNLLLINTNKLCAWRHNMPPPHASWQYLCIYSPGGGGVPT